MDAIGDAPAHRETSSDLRDGGFEARSVGVQLGKIELDALKELPRHRVGVLIGIQDVGTVPVEELCERSDEAFAIGAADEQCGGLLHNQVFSR